MRPDVQTLPSFSIALVNYKTLELTKICLELLKKHLDTGNINAKNVDVWVVDNGSNDESTDYLRGLDWIHLIEREPVIGEEGFAAHGRGLDLILAQIKSDYVFLLHTDTFIYDADVFGLMLRTCMSNQNIAAVGCLEQLNRGYLRTTWRIVSRFFKHYARRIKQSLGLKTKEPKPYREAYIKSFCALWNVKLMRRHQLTFLMGSRIPGYEIQDFFKQNGYAISLISPMKLFKYLDHVEAGTVGLVSGYTDMNRRTKRKKSILQKLGNHSKSDSNE